MPIFEYKGVGAGGKSVKGLIEGDSSKTARLRLKQKGIYPTDLKEKSTSQQRDKKTVMSTGSGVKLKNLTMMIRQLSTLVKARIPLDEALSALVEQTDDSK